MQPIDFVARNEFDFTISEVAEGRDLYVELTVSARNGAGGSSITRTAT